MYQSKNRSKSNSLLAISVLTAGTVVYLHSDTLLSSITEIPISVVSTVSESFPGTKNENVVLTPVNDEELGKQLITQIPIPVIVKESKQSVFEILSPKGTGSGFLIKPGLIVTNKHVIGDNRQVNVKSLITGKITVAEVISVNVKENDIAYLSYNNLSVPGLKIGSSEETSEGETVVAIGSPIGLTGTVTVGVLSSKYRIIDGKVGQFIQHDAAISSGNSGGPLINSKGEVIAMNTLAFRSKSSQFVEIQNINMSVPIETILKFAP